MNASYHIIGLIRKKISNEHLTASDTDVSRVLGISRALVSAYKKDTVMSQETLELAQKILQLPPGELSELSMALLLESSPTTRAINAAHRYMIDQAKKYAAPVVALAIVAFGTFYASPENAGVLAFFLPFANNHYANLAALALIAALGFAYTRRRTATAVKDAPTAFGDLMPPMPKWTFTWFPIAADTAWGAR